MDIYGLVLFFIIFLQIKASEIPLECFNVNIRHRVSVYEQNCVNDDIHCEYFFRGNISMKNCMFSTYSKLSIFNRKFRSIIESNGKITSLKYFYMNSSELDLFDASNNNLTDIPAGYFDKIPNIYVIDLSSNKLQEIKSTTFTHAYQLTAILLSNNKISEIDVHSFQHLTHLNYLNLNNNNIKTLTFKFSSEASMNSLYLNNNPLNNLIESDLTLMGAVEKIFYSWNRVQFLQFPDGNNFTVIFNHNFDGIVRISNNQYEIHCDLNSFSTLIEFNATSNSCNNMLKLLPCFHSPSVKSLNLSNNIIMYIDNAALNRFEFLHKLYLRNVKLLSFNFYILWKNLGLKLLDISYNNLNTLQNPSMLQKLYALNEFNVAGNQLNNTMEIIQHLNPSIEILDLSDSIIILSSKPFHLFPKLKRLVLRNTSISSIDFNPFKRIEHLLQLDISFNDLSNVDFHILSTTLVTLEVFRCVKCQIINVTRIIQCFGNELIELDLSENFVKRMDFDGNRFLNLKRLTLSRMNMDVIEFNGQWSLPNLNYLDISYNQLQKIDLKFLSNNMMELDLNENYLTQIIHFNIVHFQNIRVKISKNCFSHKHLEQMVLEKRNVFDDNWRNQKLCTDKEDTKLSIGDYIKIGLSFINIYIGIGLMIVIFIVFIVRGILIAKRLPNSDLSQSESKDFDEYFTIIKPSHRLKLNNNTYMNVNRTNDTYAVVDKSKKKKTRENITSNVLQTDDFDIYEDIIIVPKNVQDARIPNIAKNLGMNNDEPIYDDPLDHI